MSAVAKTAITRRNDLTCFDSGRLMIRSGAFSGTAAPYNMTQGVKVGLSPARAMAGSISSALGWDWVQIRANLERTSLRSVADSASNQALPSDTLISPWAMRLSCNSVAINIMGTLTVGFSRTQSEAKRGGWTPLLEHMYCIRLWNIDIDWTLSDGLDQPFIYRNACWLFLPPWV